jgi:molecular chaperone GrpE
MQNMETEHSPHDDSARAAPEQRGGDGERRHGGASPQAAERTGEPPAEARASAPAPPTEAAAQAGGRAADDALAQAPGRATDDAVAQAEARATEMEDRWKRAVAEFINYKRRAEQELAEALRGANAVLIVDLLPVLDDLELALASVPPEEAGSKWVEGVRLVERKFRQTLERYGVQAIDTVGRPFDPNQHEAVSGRGPIVARVYRRGYRLNGRVLRPAQVEVGETPAGAPAAGAAPTAEERQPATSTEGW